MWHDPNPNPNPNPTPNPNPASNPNPNAGVWHSAGTPSKLRTAAGDAYEGRFVHGELRGRGLWLGLA